MLKFEKHTPANANTANIIKDYEELDSYDGYPLIYLGKNQLDNYLIGSLVEIDYELRLTRYMQVPISDEQYIKYKNREITYRQILQNTDSIFIFDITDHGESIYEIEGKQLPEEYLPSENSYIPEQEE